MVLVHMVLVFVCLVVLYTSISASYDSHLGYRS